MKSVLVWLSATLALWAQAPPLAGPPKPGARAPRTIAPIDLTGDWVAQITEDWRYRIAPAPKGDVGGVPVNAEGRKMAAAWDASKEDACMSYGVGGILRMPGRLRLSWESDDVLKLEAEAGNQMRLLAFGQPRAQAGDWQGVSAASWDRPAPPVLGGIPLGNGGVTGASLKVVTTKAKPGYLTRNGVPYGANAIFTEYYDILEVPGGDALLVVSVEVVDPQYLSQPYWFSVHFKKEAAGTGWNPHPCVAN